MKFNLIKNELSKVLKTLKHGADLKRDVIKLTLTDNSLKLTVFNGGSVISTIVEVEGKKNGEVYLSFTEFAKIIEKVKNLSLEFYEDDKGDILILHCESLKYKYHFDIDALADFKIISVKSHTNAPIKELIYNVDLNDFSEGIHSVIPFMWHKGYLYNEKTKGISLKIANGEMLIIGTDSFRCAEYRMSYNGSEDNCELLINTEDCKGLKEILTEVSKEHSKCIIKVYNRQMLEPIKKEDIIKMEVIAGEWHCEFNITISGNILKTESLFKNVLESKDIETVNIDIKEFLKSAKMIEEKDHLFFIMEFSKDTLTLSGEKSEIKMYCEFSGLPLRQKANLKMYTEIANHMKEHGTMKIHIPLNYDEKMVGMTFKGNDRFRFLQMNIEEKNN